MKIFGTFGACVAAALVLGGSGCKKEEAPAAGTPPVETTPAAPGQATPDKPTADGSEKAKEMAANAVAGKPILVVMEQGAEPRTQLRFAPAAGSSELATMTMGMNMEMTLQGQKIPVKMPKFLMKMGVDILSVDASSGNFDYKLNLAEAGVAEGASPGVDPAVLSTMREMLGKMKGMNGTATVSPRGDVQKANFQVPPDAPAEIRQVMDSFQQSMQQISVPFPEEAVGVGAKWQVTSVIEQNGMKLGMISVFELKAKDADSVTVSHVIKQTANEQFIEAPGMPAGSRAKLTSLKGEGSGEGTFKFAKVLPQSFASKLSLSLDMSVEVGGQKQSISMSTDLALDLKGE